MEFRKDLNGLRAIAVAAVVLYHYGVWPFTGGFVGVDIFFVISGFLLTSIAYRDLQAGTYSAWQFLLRRMRRILPALVVVVAFCVLWETNAYLPNTYKHLVRVATDVLLMRSNVDFDSVGYFTPDASRDILLHTWSLAVESQYYLVFALLCGAFWPRNGARRRAFGKVLFALAAAASLAWCQWRTATDPLGAFYLFPSRAWEFLAGAATAVYLRTPARRASREFLAIAGMALLIVSIFGFSAASPFPGWRAALPVSGSLMIILAGGSALTRLLDTSPFQFLGTISYSVYLWHWPILIVFRERTGRDPSAQEVVALIACCLIVGWISYALVERSTRRRLRNAPLLGGWAASIAIGLALSTVLSKTNGLPHRLPDYVQPAIVASIKGYKPAGQCLRNGSKQQKEPVDSCRIGVAATNPTMLVWGDSFADRLAPSLDNPARKLGLSGIVATMGGCPPFRGHAFPGSGAEKFPSCERYANSVFDYLTRNPTIRLVVLVGNWKLYDADSESKVVRDVAQILADRQGRLIFVSAVPDPFADVTNEWARRQIQVGHAIAEWSTSRSSEEATHAKGVKIASLALQTGAVTVVDPFKYLCSDTACFIVKGGQSMFSDNAHLSDLGVEHLAPGVESAMGEHAASVATAAQEREAPPEAVGVALHISGRENSVR
jgi:peptidoglycan/LPS O-acetylase OafA/YrhL